ncbi:electron transport complex subunit RsxG [Thalassotalea sp. PLHSN55]|uniref:electron transport complex subunit RsxG n=1 Tax=Thalassotalea sp. PLHSN55 TaxID=3435888 RepID=UPI003F82C2B6
MKIAIEKNARILGLFAIACTAVVGVVNLLTKDRIEIQKQQYLLNTLNEIIAPQSYDNDLYQDCVLYDDENQHLQTAYLARNNNQGIAAALTATAPDGYNGNIEIIVAVQNDNTVSGVRVLEHKETPGLGDKIEPEKSDWILVFKDKQLESESDSRWNVAKDGGMFDQFTGATITPRAVVKAVKRTVLYYEQHKDDLFASTRSCHQQ